MNGIITAVKHHGSTVDVYVAKEVHIVSFDHRSFHHMISIEGNIEGRCVQVEEDRLILLKKPQGKIII